MKKVTIEITETGWSLKTHIQGNEFVEYGVLDSKGATHKGDELDDMDWMSEELYDALNSFFCYDVAKALKDY